MKNNLKVTLRVIFILILGFILWDAYLLYDGGSINTISYGMWYYAVKYPMINSLLSMLIGHFFWKIEERDFMKDDKKKMKKKMKVNKKKALKAKKPVTKKVTRKKK